MVIACGSTQARATDSQWKRLSPLCHPEQLTCLCQVKGEIERRPFVSLPATKEGCPISRAFFARCGIPRTLTFRATRAGNLQAAISEQKGMTAACKTVPFIRASARYFEVGGTASVCRWTLASTSGTVPSFTATSAGWP